MLPREQAMVLAARPDLEPAFVVGPAGAAVVFEVVEVLLLHREKRRQQLFGLDVNRVPTGRERRLAGSTAVAPGR